jgi:hypothetical protein
MQGDGVMGEIIEIGREKEPPLIPCPFCGEVIRISLQPFENDIKGIIRDNCPKCGGDVHVALLVLADQNLQRLLNYIQTVIDAVKNAQGNVR